MTNTVSIKWFPPSWLQIKANDTIIYVDPAYLRTYFSKYPKKIEFSKWPDPIDGLPEDLEKADVILITHDHADHCKQVTVNRLRQKTTVLVAPKRCLKKLGNNIKIIEPGKEIKFGDVQIQAVHAYNTQEGSSTQKVHHKGNVVGYRINIEGRIIYHAGDTDFIPEMKALSPIDVAFLPIGGTYTMDVDEAVEAALAIKPKVVIPIHHAKSNPNEFKVKLETVSDIVVMPLQIGEIYFLKGKAL